MNWRERLEGKYSNKQKEARANIDVVTICTTTEALEANEANEAREGPFSFAE